MSERYRAVDLSNEVVTKFSFKEAGKAITDVEQIRKNPGNTTPIRQRELISEANNWINFLEGENPDVHREYVYDSKDGVKLETTDGHDRDEDDDRWGYYDNDY